MQAPRPPSQHARSSCIQGLRWAGAFGLALPVCVQLAWSADSRLLASGSKDSTVKVWEVKTKKLLEDLPGHADEVFTVDWSPDGGEWPRTAGGGKWEVGSGKRGRGGCTTASWRLWASPPRGECGAPRPHACSDRTPRRACAVQSASLPAARIATSRSGGAEPVVCGWSRTPRLVAHASGGSVACACTSGHARLPVEDLWMMRICASGYAMSVRVSPYIG